MSLAGIYCTQDVRLRIRSGLNDNGEPTFSTSVTTTGTMKRVRRLLRTHLGEQAESFAFVIVRPTETVGDGMQISVDGGTTWYDALSVDHVRDVMGTLMHYEVSI